MQTPTGYPVGRSRLKAIPILIPALADHEHGIALGIGIVDVLTLEFARGSVEGPDFPERFFGGVRICSHNRREQCGHGCRAYSTCFSLSSYSIHFPHRL